MGGPGTSVAPRSSGFRGAPIGDFNISSLGPDENGQNRAANATGPLTAAAYGMSEYALWQRSFIERMTSVSGVGEMLGSSFIMSASNRYAFLPLVRMGLSAIGVTRGVPAFALTVVSLSALSSGAMTLWSRALHGAPQGSDGTEEGFLRQWGTSFLYSLPSMAIGMGAMQGLNFGKSFGQDLLLQIPQTLSSVGMSYGLEALGRAPQSSMSFGERLIREGVEGAPFMLTGRAFGRGFDAVDAGRLHTPAMEERRFRTRVDQVRTRGLAAWLSELSNDPVRNAEQIVGAKRELVEVWAKARGGTRPIQKILIANNGLSAERIIKGARDLSAAISSELGIHSSHSLIETVGLAAADDLAAKPNYLSNVDKLIPCPDKKTPANLFLDYNRVLDIAVAEKVDAIAVGWGFGAEQAEFARLCQERNIKFIGPPPEAMEALGGKISSKHVAEAAKVPVLPWSKGVVTDARAAASMAKKLGWMIAIKADAGGGGKGIRFFKGLQDPEFVAWCGQKSKTADEHSAGEYVQSLFASCKQEARNFGNDAVFIEQMAPAGVRHIEIQIEADEHGHARALLERDCSPQISRQKVFEEGPAVFVPPAVRARMRLAAERLAQKVGYHNVGTVEFLYDPTQNQFYFMEMNTRLQVEHPVTEMLLGIDLVGQQFRRAMGIPLTRFEQNEFADARPNHHVIAARINAKDPERGMAPSTGTITRLDLPTGIQGVHAYSSLQVGAQVAGSSDSQIAHVFATGRTRAEACRRLAEALRKTTIEGVKTTLPFSIDVLGNPAFVDGHQIDTGWLDQVAGIYASRGPSPSGPVALAAAAIHRFELATTARRIQFEGEIKGGRRPEEALSRTSEEFDLPFAGQTYKSSVRSLGDGRYAVSIDGRIVGIDAFSREGEYTLTMGGRTHRISVSGNESELSVQVDGQRFLAAAKDPSRVRAFAPGQIVSVAVQIGQEVKVGDDLLICEAMKMQMPLKAEVAGRVKEIKFQAGQTVKAGDLLVELEGNGAAVEGSQRIEIDEEFVSPFETAERLRAHLASHPQPIEPVHDLFRRAMRGGTYAVGRGDSPYDAALASHRTHAEQVRREFLALPEAVRHGFLANQARTSLSEAQSSTLAQMDDLLSRNRELIDLFTSDEGVFARGDSLSTEGNSAFALSQSHTALPIKQKILEGVLAVSRDLPYAATSQSLVSSLESLSRLNGEAYRTLRSTARDLVNYARPSRVEINFNDVFSRANESDEARAAAIGELVSHPTLSTRHLVGALGSQNSAERVFASEVILKRAYARYRFTEGSFRVESPEGAPGSPSDYCRFEFNDRRSEVTRLAVALDINGHSEAIETGLRRAAQALTGERAKLDTSRDATGDTVEIVLHGLDRNSLANAEALGGILRAALNPSEGTALFSSVCPKRVTFTVARDGYPGYYTFRPDGSGEFVEDRPFRGLHPHSANLLEMGRFEGWRLNQLEAHNPLIRTWVAETGEGKSLDRRLTTRAIVPDAEIQSTAEGLTMRGFDRAYTEASRALTEELDRISPRERPLLNHLYLRVLSPIEATDVHDVGRLIRKTIESHRYHRGALMGSPQVEVRATVKNLAGEGQDRDVLFILKRPTSPHPELQPYVVLKPNGTNKLVKLDRYLESVGEGGRGLEASDYIGGRPYSPKSALDKLRLARNAAGAVYVYDRPEVMAQKVRALWEVEGMGDRCPETPLASVELVLRDGALVPETREPMQNDRAMVAWRMTAHLPHEAEPRQFILLSSDATHENGTVSPREGEFYKAVTSLARREGLPFFQVLEGFGARMKIDKTVTPYIKLDPESGHIYLTNDDYNRALNDKQKAALPDRWRNASSTVGSLVQGQWIELLINGTSQRVFRITTILGDGFDLNTENLSGGSGTMARELEQTYHAVPTMTLVSDTVVGIHTYLARIGRRVIQALPKPMILTGHRAINAMLRRDVFQTPQELGGYDPIMGRNGVSQYGVTDEAAGHNSFLDWLSFLPRKVGERAPVRPGVEIDDGRNLKTLLLGDGETEGLLADRAGKPKLYDPRHLIEAVFDGKSFRESAPSWAATVVTGRARIGGKPVGVIAVDPRVVMDEIPANLALEGHPAQKVPRPGALLHPQSALKLSQTLLDLDREGLPAVLLANFKGFPGDPFAMGPEAVTKYGAMIVEALVAAQKGGLRQPVIIAIPPFAEVRGGAQVVIDRAINPDAIRYIVVKGGEVSVLPVEGMMELPLLTSLITKDLSSGAREKWTAIARGHQTPERALAVGTVDKVVEPEDMRRAIYDALEEAQTHMEGLRASRSQESPPPK